MQNKTSKLTKDLINGCVRRQCAIEDRELAFQTLRNIVTPSAGMDHSADELHVHDIGELARFVKIEEAAHLHRLTRDLVCDLENSG